MKVVISTGENGIYEYTFPADSEVRNNCPIPGFVSVVPKDGLPHWFNMSYLIAFLPSVVVHEHN